MEQQQLSKRFEIKLERKIHSSTYTYQAAVTSGFGGHVTGGGSRVGTSYRKGFRLTIRNLEEVTRDYRFEFVLFENEPARIVRRTIVERVYKVRPGYAAIQDIDLGESRGSEQLYLEQIQVVDETNHEVEKFQPHWLLQNMTEPLKWGCGAAILRFLKWAAIVIAALFLFTRVISLFK